MKHILTSVFVNTEDKDGKPYLTKKDKKPFKRVVIKIAPDEANPQEYDNKYLSCVSFNDNDAFLVWQTGMEVDITVEKKQDFWNFRSPDRYDLLESRMAKAENDIKALNEFMVGDESAKKVDVSTIGVSTSNTAPRDEEFDSEPPF